MVIPLNRVYCKHSIYHKTSYNEVGEVKDSENPRHKPQDCRVHRGS